MSKRLPRWFIVLTRGLLTKVSTAVAEHLQTKVESCRLGKRARQVRLQFLHSLIVNRQFGIMRHADGELRAVLERVGKLLADAIDKQVVRADELSALTVAAKAYLDGKDVLAWATIKPEPFADMKALPATVPPAAMRAVAWMITKGVGGHDTNAVWKAVENVPLATGATEPNVTTLKSVAQFDAMATELLRLLSSQHG